MAQEMNVDLIIRSSAFIGIFAIMATWERLAPRRQWYAAKAKRWAINLVMAGIHLV
jgi:hypothetical protein